VRVPVTGREEPADGFGTVAPPITELWLESSDEVAPEVARAAEVQAREALSLALWERRIEADAAGATDAVLFVRERAVGLTAERRSQQTWAKVGIVVGIVVVVAAAVYLAVRGSKGSSGPAPAKAAPPPKPPVTVQPRAVPAIVRPPVPTALGHAVPVPRGYSSSPVFIGFWFQFSIPPRPLVLEPDPGEAPVWGAPEPPAPYLPGPIAPAGGDPADLPEPPPPEPIASVALQLPPLDDVVSFRVQDRGLFAGPQTAIQLDLLDRATGRLLWSKAVSAEADPMDGEAVAKLLDSAFAGVGWARRR